MGELTVLSLGWGVQSWTLAAMMALGELPPIDFAIHSDTTWEREQTYRFAEQWTPWLEERGVRVVTVGDPSSHGHIKDEWGGAFIPAYTNANSNGFGRLRRQCTGRWKLDPIRRYISRQLVDRGLSKSPGVVEQWLGITVDEIQRARDSDVKYIRNRFPLLDLGMTRAGCLAWLDRNGLPSPGKSSCTFCPFHSGHAWQAMKRQGGSDWQQAVDVDKRIRNKRPPYPLYVHRSCIPLEEAVTIPEDFGYTQLSMLDNDDQDTECDGGYCFL